MKLRMRNWWLLVPAVLTASVAKLSAETPAAPDAWKLALTGAERVDKVIRPEEDAAGAVDGDIRDGFGFHTGEDDRPFWQVDLGRSQPLGRIVIHNRHQPERAARLQVLLSDDGAQWRTVYDHNGQPTPLIECALERAAARYVRLQLPRRGYLHLAEVQVFAPGETNNLALRRPATQSSSSPWSTRSITLEKSGAAIAVSILDPRLAEAERAGLDVKDLRAARGALWDAQAPADDPRWAALYDRVRNLQRGLAAAAAKQLLDQGIEALVFVRRPTLNGNHVYTEHDEGQFRPGGGLSVLDLRTGAVRDIAHDFTRTGVVNRFDLSFDARRIVFDFKPSAHEGYRLYEVNVDGTGLRPLTAPDPSAPRKTDDMQPCYLPDGGIAFTSTRTQYGVLCDGGDRLTVCNLWRIEADGSGLRQLSNSPLNEQSPTLLPDGRILYKRWEYVDKAAGNVKALWAMRPDGSFSEEIYGNEIAFPETMIYGRAIPGAPGRIVFLGASHFENTAVGAVVKIDIRDDPRRPESMQFITPDIHALGHTGFHFRDADGQWFHDRDGRRGRLFKDPYPIHENLYLVSYKPGGLEWSDPKGYELALLNGRGETTPLYRDDTYSAWEPHPLVPRDRPPKLEMTRIPGLAEQNRSQVLLVNVYEGLPDVPRGTIKYLRILEQVGRPWTARKTWGGDGDGMAHSAIGDGMLSLKVMHGVVPVEADGSASFFVPAMRNIYLQALDEHYMAVQTQRTFVNYMPGEARSCLGCHEERGATSPPAAPLAAARKPWAPMPQPGDATAARVFDYDRQIQPIWDRHCLKCHDVEHKAGGLVLTGTPKGVYSESYQNLVALGRKPGQLLGTRAPRNENAASLGQDAVQSLPAYVLGSPSSPLAAFLGGEAVTLRDPARQAYAARLRKAHPDVKLSREEFLRVVTWLDVSAPFHPSYWGRLNAQYRDHPHYRPAVSVEEAVMREVPPALRGGEVVRQP